MGNNAFTELGWARKIVNSTGVKSAFKAVFSIPSAIAIFLIITILLLIGPRLPVSSLFTTKGVIYVDSPEVYTRERLVNDRYDQDYWLRKQLRNLDEARNFTTLVKNELLQSGNTSRQKKQIIDEASEQQAPRKEIGILPFDQEFRIRSSIRDAIRQSILENMLDDRHDLTGNSVYGLKFDTTIIPGSNTHKRAYVRVVLHPPQMFDVGLVNTRLKQLGKNEKSDLQPHTLFFYSVEPERVFSPGQPLQQPYQLYRDWLDSIEERLNTYVANKFESEQFLLSCASDKFEPDGLLHRTINEAVELVLSQKIDMAQFNKRSSSERSAQVYLPTPWSKYIFMTYRTGAGSEPCARQRPVFDIAHVWNIVYLFEEGMAIPEEFRFYTKTVSKKRSLAIHPSSDAVDQFRQFVEYDIDDAIIDYAIKNDNVRDYEGHAYISVPSGLFNFIENIENTDAYSYAVFPKNDVVGTLSGSSLDLSVSALQDSGSPWLRFVRDLRGSQLSSVLIGFGDGYRKEADLSSNGAIEFGWVISSHQKMQPTQKTQLALVSVPAWTKQLLIDVETGWLDDNSNEELDRRFKLTVPVPPDFDAFDSLLAEGQVQRRPKIMDELMDRSLQLVACEDAGILIPGSRLWRSATVTLGAQKAQRITVLPNMEGIIAEFQPVEIPRVTHPGNSDVKVKLRVWTSEGVDTARRDIGIKVPNSGKCQMTEPVAAN